jgi:hypothetical protein
MTTEIIQEDEETAREDVRGSVVLFDPFDTEETSLTRLARRAAWAAIDEEVEPEKPEYQQPVSAWPVQFVKVGGRTVALEMRGQSSFTAHGKQGIRTERMGFLYRLDETFPVLLVFVEGATKWRWAWLRELPPAESISKGDGTAGSRRSGWHVRELHTVEGPFTLLSSLPAPPVSKGLF